MKKQEIIISNINFIQHFFIQYNLSMTYHSTEILKIMTSFVQPLGQLCVSIGILHTIQDSSRKFSVCVQGSSVNSSMILLCSYIFIECI